MKAIRKSQQKEEKVDYNKGITSITVGGFKSIAEETTIEIRPLTLLAGANSSGKSSMIQPLLMLKQTLEASFDPGPLQLMGSLIEFTNINQFFSNVAQNKSTEILTISIKLNNSHCIRIDFTNINRNIEIENCTYQYENTQIAIPRIPDFSIIRNTLRSLYNDYFTDGEDVKDGESINRKRMRIKNKLDHFEGDISRDRCFYYLEPRSSIYDVLPNLKPEYYAERIIDIIHIPGLRGNPERIYNRAAISVKFSGNFINYVASIILHWQDTQLYKHSLLESQMRLLGLADRIEAKLLNDALIEIRVSRLPISKKSTKNDLVNIADVGVGVSQVLPVLVALLTAEEGQLVHLEQPELHLHPKAQVAMAEILAEAARRGVRVVVETHSALLLLAIQTLIAEEKLPTELVKLHWFERDLKTGVTKVSSRELSEYGSFGDWPEDFGEVELKIQNRYLNAAERYHALKNNGQS